MKAKKTPFYILMIYIVMQLSSIVFIRPLYNYFKEAHPQFSQHKLELYTQGWYMFMSMLIAIVLSFIFIARDKTFFSNYKDKMPLSQTILWGILGFGLVLAGQMLGSMIETMLGIAGESENTSSLLTIVSVAPITVLAIGLFGPILEELVFRRVIFGSLKQVTSFWLSALVSAMFFALLHNDIKHILLYAITGFILAFLYNKTGRIIAPMIAHISLNTFVLFM